MGKSDQKNLLTFLKPFPPAIRKRVMELREMVWDLYPQSNELIYDNYNALAFGWSVTEKLGHTFCTIAVGRTSHNIHFGFYWGAHLPDPKKLLLGEGSQYRYFLANDPALFPESYALKVLKSAFRYSLEKASSSAGTDKKIQVTGRTTVKSISPVKREKAKRPARKK